METTVDIKIKNRTFVFKNLKSKYPHLFTKPYVPFAIGIFKQIADENPDYSLNALRHVIRSITAHPLYLANFLNPECVNRYDLKGETYPIDEVHRITAAGRLKGVLKAKKTRKIRSMKQDELAFFFDLIRKAKLTCTSCEPDDALKVG